MALTQVDQGLLGSNAQYTGFKNRIYNGQMQIDQRNAGASVTPTNGQYLVDRWFALAGAASKFSAQQSSIAPAGFANSILLTSLSAYSVAATDNFGLRQNIEGFNTADFNFGTANASALSLSFWVYSSLTGTFGGSVQNAAGTRSYVFSYSIPSANTWTKITVPITGDTGGTWVGASNAASFTVNIPIGNGSTYSTSSTNSWLAANYQNVTGATSVVGTNGATFYITGVQLEKGSTATSFDYRPYGTELVLCQRYCQKSYNYATVPGSNVAASGDFLLFGGWGTANAAKVFYAEHKVPLRPGTQTLSFWDAVGNASKISTYDTGFTRTDNVNPNGGNGITENRHFTAPGTTTVNGWAWAYLVTSEL